MNHTLYTRAALGTLLVLSAVACGQKGPLVLPPGAVEPAPPAAVDAARDESVDPAVPEDQDSNEADRSDEQY